MIRKTNKQAIIIIIKLYKNYPIKIGIKNGRTFVAKRSTTANVSFMRSKLERNVEFCKFEPLCTCTQFVESE